MAKYRDKEDLGKSSICPYRKGESSRSRHARRLRTNVKMDLELMDWATSRGFAVSISNNNHHWKLYTKGKIAEWWPSSAKLVFDKEWKKGIHCHDIEKLKSAMENRWKLDTTERE